MTQHLEESRRHPPPYRVCMIGLDFADRSRLYDRIDRRVDAMMEAGLLEEARRVLSQEGSKTALQAIGYKELAPYLAGEIPLEQAVENIKRETRRYAKRQLTWFRGKNRSIGCIWMNANADRWWKKQRPVFPAFYRRDSARKEGCKQPYEQFYRQTDHFHRAGCAGAFLHCLSDL